MKQYQCNNIPQVARKVAELTNTRIDRYACKQYCNGLKKRKETSDSVDYEDGDGNDVSVFFGYDGEYWYVGINE